MIVSNFLNSIARPKNEILTLPELVGQMSGAAASGQVVDAESAKRIASAYRAKNIISDDVAKIPLQLFDKRNGKINRVSPDAVTRNLAYLLEVSPNRRMTPFLFKKLIIEWMLFWGNALIWTPPTWPRELLLLPVDVTEPYLDNSGELWYRVKNASNQFDYYPAVEVLHLMINPDRKGYWGRSVLQYAKDTMGRQLGAYRTQDQFYAQGLNTAGILWVNGDLNGPARNKMRDEYESVMNGQENAGRLAIFDNKIAKFEAVTMKPSDAQFLEGISATDIDIANFFGIPAYKLNMGKESYQSNSQQDIDYLKTTLDSYLVPFEQGILLKWITDQTHNYARFNRDAFLSTDAKSRAEYLGKKILTAQMSPNEAREIEDQSGYEGGDFHYIPGNMLTVEPAGRNA